MFIQLIHLRIKVDHQNKLKLNSKEQKKNRLTKTETIFFFVVGRSIKYKLKTRILSF
jgi:hypothetical protein